MYNRSWCDEWDALGADTVHSRLVAMHRFELRLDSMCTRSIFGEKSLLYDIRGCTPKLFKGVGETVVVSQVGTHRDFEEVYFKKGTANLPSLAEV